MFQLIVYGRGGQGAKTLAMLLAESAIEAGKYAEAYPDFGPERTGAPIRAFFRVDSSNFTTREPIVNPDAVVILDDSLLFSKNEGPSIAKAPVIVVNSSKDKVEIEKALLEKGVRFDKIHVINAQELTSGYQNKVHFSAPVIGRIIKVTEAVSLDDVKKAYSRKFSGKLGDAVIEETLAALEEGYYGL